MDAPDPSWKPFVIGGAGALVAAIRFMPGDTRGAKLANAVCGALIAGFMAPATVEWFHLTGSGIFGGIAFLWGSIGVSFMQAVMDFIRSTKFGEMLSSWGTRK